LCVGAQPAVGNLRSIHGCLNSDDSVIRPRFWTGGVPLFSHRRLEQSAKRLTFRVELGDITELGLASSNHRIHGHGIQLGQMAL